MIQQQILLGSQTAVDEADIRLITGDQRSGKTNTGVASAIDDYFLNLTGIISPSGTKIKAKYLSKDDVKFCKLNGIRYPELRYVKVMSDDERHSKIIKIPKDYLVESPVKIFSNLHFYGVYFFHISAATIIQYANTELFNNGWVILDESRDTDARDSMTVAGKAIAQWGASTGKRNAHLIIIVQYNTMTDVRNRLAAKTRIECTYNKDYKIIHCEVTKAKQNPYTYDYFAPPYWQFFNTNEIIMIPQEKIDRALAKMYARS